jgi:hypothetical protein
MTPLQLQTHVMEALRDFARKPCHRSNCGTVCLCGSCHARKALEVLDGRSVRFIDPAVSGHFGGLARAAKLPSSRRKEIARIGAKARWHKES